MTCKCVSDDDQEICVNGDCPACGDWCPCINWPEICKYAESDEA